MSAQKVPPGGEAQIEVKINTANRRGQLVKTVSVMSNDPKQPRAVLTVKANIEAPAGEAVARPGPKPAVRQPRKLIRRVPNPLAARPNQTVKSR